nr:MAG TPA: hypothetical protein [Caudoviricetes sp.]
MNFILVLYFDIFFSSLLTVSYFFVFSKHFEYVYSFCIY